MAKDVKCVEVEISAEENYISIYQNFGWILKSSQKKEKTSNLTFERERERADYKRIVELETEFWDLDKVKKPKVDTSKGIGEWAYEEFPILRKPSQAKFNKFVYGLIILLEIVGGIAITSTSGSMDFFYMMIDIIVVAVIVTWILRKYLFNEFFFANCAIKKGIKSPNSKYGKKLGALYNAAVSKTNRFEKSRARMAEILEEVKGLN